MSLFLELCSERSCKGIKELSGKFCRHFFLVLMLNNEDFNQHVLLQRPQFPALLPSPCPDGWPCVVGSMGFETVCVLLLLLSYCQAVVKYREQFLSVSLMWGTGLLAEGPVALWATGYFCVCWRRACTPAGSAWFLGRNNWTVQNSWTIQEWFWVA